jgi:hypothetical protein
MTAPLPVCSAKLSRILAARKSEGPYQPINFSTENYVGSYARPCETPTMADDANDDGRDDEPIRLPAIDSPAYAHSYDAELVEEMGTFHITACQPLKRNTRGPIIKDGLGFR